ncbi:PREDICTED: cytochrome P450 72A15-like [Camelina sativa]|uniref:Cytochrome P450 72A15-like n=1 Tax=Camelina sativa TaxID=90675 RepID=A0ABM0XKE6_CAMSA|nr:PREDICTED: cytochrome P450 72A15-like [Camelina sativa]
MMSSPHSYLLHNFQPLYPNIFRKLSTPLSLLWKKKMEISVASVTISVAVVVTSWLVWRALQWVWFKPKMLESYLRRQGLPGTSYTPLVGDVKRNFSMLTEARSKPINLTDDITPRVMPHPLQMLKTHGRTYFSWFGPVPIITIMDPEQIKEVFNKVYDFQKPHTFPLATLIAKGLANYDGDKWAKHRRIINPAFHLEKIKNMVPAFHQSCSEVLGEWEKLVSDKGSSCEVDVWPGLVSMTADVISRTAFGSSYKEGQRIFELQAELAQLIIQAFRKAIIPGFSYLPTKGNRRMKAKAREIQVILRGIVNKRLRAREAGEAPSDDLLGILLESNLGQTKGNGMSTEDLMEECKLFYFAGQETTSVLLVWTMVLLSQHQDWQARAREEVKQVFGDKEPDAEGLNQLKVMTMILYEVLRLYPPVTQLTRAIHKEMKLGDLTLPGGVQISLPILLVQRDTELWGKDAGEFKPERFKDGLSKATKSQVSFFPFAWGPRICIGQNFAMLEAKMAMALILQKFSFELSPSYLHAPYTIITIHPQFGAQLILQKL